eukprot:TRINITY_DN9690_c0_g1_i1.p1 TRINITY_DN9690_c0_g1~~TRINITY_DN9690_c0_g1_i1.p1  ORF type:complete len:111 (+),score=22.44 TRINITY_DN9690_c0_g1_i1:320-652(+)
MFISLTGLFTRVFGAPTSYNLPFPLFSLLHTLFPFLVSSEAGNLTNPSLFDSLLPSLISFQYPHLTRVLCVVSVKDMEFNLFNPPSPFQDSLPSLVLPSPLPSLPHLPFP